MNFDVKHPATVRPADGHIQRFSQIAAACYADAPRSIRWMQTYRPWICPFEELLPLVPRGSRVLDIGCGAGLFLILAAATDKEITGFGFDANARVVGAAEQAACNPLCATSKLQFETLPAQAAWPAGEFDVISLIDVLHHVPPEQRAGIFATAATKLKPGGVLIYKDIAARPLWMSTMNRLHDLVVARETISYEPLQRVCAAAHKAGLDLQRSWRPFRWWYSHEAAVFRKQ